MKVCFVGVGSIARRHIRNLREIMKEQQMDLQIDAVRRPESVTVSGIDRTYYDPSTLPDDYDAIFITNPTEKHLDTLKKYHNKGKHFFIEKPAVSVTQIDEAKEMCLRHDSIYYVACPLRYSAVIQWIRENIKQEDIISIRSISSSYLPDWRPMQDYRLTYSAHKELGGGVSIDLIHEWDYITYLFGWPIKVSSMIGKKSTLEIDSDDYAIYIAEYKDKIVELHLDYFGRKTIREIQLIMKDDTIVGDILNNHVNMMYSGKSIHFNEERDDFQKRELRHFVNMVEGTEAIENGFSHGIKVLELTQGII